MKSALHLLALASVLFLASCSGGYKLGNTASRDDVYASSTPQAQTNTNTTTPESYTPQESTNPNIGDNSERANKYNERQDEDGDTYVTNNYYDYDNDEDYYYSRRIRRWYDPYYGFGYYSNVYANPYYWWGPSYYQPGFSLSINVGPLFVTPWYNPYPYYSYSSFYPWYTSYPYPYYGYYNPYTAYGYGYNQGYWNGYHDGYWGNPYGYNSYSGYYGNDYGYGNGGSAGNGYYYGHRNSGVVNTSSTGMPFSDGGRRDNSMSIDKSEIGKSVGQPTSNIGRIEQNNAVTVKPSVGHDNPIQSDRFDNPSTRATSPVVGKPGNETRNEPTNTKRADAFDNTPVQKPHNGSTSIDVNPDTQVKPQPSMAEPRNNTTQQKPQQQYQWDHPQTPRSNDQMQQAPRGNQIEAPRQENWNMRSNDIQPEQRNENQYQVPRGNSYEQPRSEQQDEYVSPRQPQYETPRQQQGGWSNDRDNAPRPMPQVQPQSQQRTYEAPRQQPQVEQPRQQQQPVLKAAPRNDSGDNGKKRIASKR